MGPVGLALHRNVGVLAGTDPVITIAGDLWISATMFAVTALLADLWIFSLALVSLLGAAASTLEPAAATTAMTGTLGAVAAMFGLKAWQDRHDGAAVAPGSGSLGSGSHSPTDDSGPRR